MKRGIKIQAMILVFALSLVYAGGRSRGGFSTELDISMLWLDKDIMEHIVENESNLAQRDFDFSSNKMIGLGFTSYSRKDCGIKYGGGIRAAYKIFKSDEYTKMYEDTASSSDSLEMDVETSLRVFPAHLGFFFEKSFQLGPVDLHSGLLAGGGGFMVFKNTKQSEDLFTNVDEERESDEDEYGFAFAPFLAFDINAGAGFRLSDNIGLAVDFVLESKYMPSGFTTGTDLEDMTSVNPGVRLRLIFG